MTGRFELISRAGDTDSEIIRVCGAEQRILVTDDGFGKATITNAEGIVIRERTLNLAANPEKLRVLLDLADRKFNGPSGLREIDRTEGNWEIRLLTDNGKERAYNGYYVRSWDAKRVFSIALRKCFDDLTLYGADGGADLRHFPLKDLSELEKAYGVFEEGTDLLSYIEDVNGCYPYLHSAGDEAFHFPVSHFLEGYREKMPPYTLADNLIGMDFAGGAGCRPGH